MLNKASTASLKSLIDPFHLPLSDLCERPLAIFSMARILKSRTRPVSGLSNNRLASTLV